MRVVGPLGELVTLSDTPPFLNLADHANLLTVTRRVAAADAEYSYEGLLSWCAHASNGRPAELVRGARVRRARAIEMLCADSTAADGRTPPTAWQRTIEMSWRAVVGAGSDTPSETALRLHGTYGIPYLPSSSLKGLASTWAGGEGQLPEAHHARIFGCAARRTRQSTQGSVTFLDGLPADDDVPLELDVLTPHVQPYYTDPSNNPPAEYWNPVPTPFLAVGRARFDVAIIGPSSDAQTAGRLLLESLTLEGIGAKTAAGYGYADPVSKANSP